MYCSKCGNTLGEDSLFCTKCGKQISKEKVLVEKEQEADKANTAENSTDSIVAASEDKQNDGAKKKPAKLLLSAAIAVVVIAAIIAGVLFFTSSQDDNPFVGTWEHTFPIEGSDVLGRWTMIVSSDGTIKEITHFDRDEAIEDFVSHFTYEFHGEEIRLISLDGLWFNSGRLSADDSTFTDDFGRVYKRIDNTVSEMSSSLPEGQSNTLVDTSEEMPAGHPEVDADGNVAALTENNFTRYSYGFRNFGGMIIDLGYVGYDSASLFDVRAEVRFTSKTEFNIYRIDIVNPNHPGVHDEEILIGYGSISATDDFVQFNYYLIEDERIIDIYRPLGGLISSGMQYEYNVMAEYDYGDWGQLLIWNSSETKERIFDIWFPAE